MTLRLSLVIDGDATGVKKAAADAGLALGDMAGKVSAAQGVLGGAGAANDNLAIKTGLATRQFGLLNGIIRSTVDTVALGVPPTSELALILERLSLSAGEEGAAAVFGRLKATLAAVLTPMNLLIGTTAAVIGGGYLLYQNIKQQELAFADLSERIGETLQQLHGLQSNAALSGGIGQSDFLAQMQKFGTLVGEAQHGLGSLAETFSANGVHAQTFNQYLAQAANLIANAANQQEKYRIIQQLGLPQTREWVTFLSQGGDAILKASQQANEFGSTAEQEMIAKARQFDTAWAQGWNNFENAGKTALINIANFKPAQDSFVWKLFTLGGGYAGEGVAPGSIQIPGTPLLGSKPSGQGGIGGNVLAGPYNEPSGKPTITAADAKHDIELDQQRIGALGALASITQIVTQKQNELTLARLAPDSLITDDDVARVKAYTEAQALGTLTIHQQADGQRIEAAAIGLGTGATAAFTAEQTKLADFRSRGIVLTKEQAAALHDEAQALGATTQAAALKRLQSDIDFERSQIGRSSEDQQIASKLRAVYGDNEKLWDGNTAGALKLNATLQQVHDTGLGALQDFNNDLRQGQTVFQAFGDAGLKALNKVEDKLFEMAYNQVFNAAFGGGSGGGGLFASLFSSGAAPAAGTSAPINIVGGAGDLAVPTFGSGGFTGALGTAEVAGVVHGKEFVVNAARTAQHRSLLEDINAGRFRGFAAGGYAGPPMPAGGAPSSSGVQINPEFKVQIVNATGNNLKATAQPAGKGFDFAVMLEMIDQNMAQNISDGSGHVSRVLSTQFGVERKY